MIDIFVSVGRTADQQQEEFVEAIFSYLRTNGFNPRALGRSDWSSEQPLKAIEKLMDQCAGTVIIAFERLYVTDGFDRRTSDSPHRLAKCKITTPWNQIEAAMAYSRRQPLLVLVEQGLRSEGLLETGFDWWIQAIELQTGSLGSREFVGVFRDWKKRVENFAQNTPRPFPEDQTATSNEQIGKWSLIELVGRLRPAEIWTALTLLVSLLVGTFTAGHRFGPLLFPEGSSAGTYSVKAVDDEPTRQALLLLTRQPPPYHGDSERGNVRAPMEAYITGFEISEHPKLLREIRVLISEIESRENPDAEDYFFLDPEFRAQLDAFIRDVQTYSTNGRWRPE